MTPNAFHRHRGTYRPFHPTPFGADDERYRRRLNEAKRLSVVIDPQAVQSLVSVLSQLLVWLLSKTVRRNVRLVDSRQDQHIYAEC